MKTILTLVNLALIFFVAHFSVSAFYGYIAGKLESAETLDMAQIGTFTPDPKEFLPQSQYSQVTKRDLFKTNFVKPPPAKKIVPPEPEPEEEIQLTQLKLELRGTITGTGSEPLAVINKKGDAMQMLYARGDAIEKAIIKTIEKGKVILLVNGRQEVLLMENRKSPASAPAPAPAEPVARETVETQDGFVETVDLTWDDVMALREKMPDIRKEIRVRPYVVKGKMDGFRVTNIKKESLLYTKLGLRNGDVISGMNDSDLGSIQDVARIYEGFNLVEGQFDSDVRIRRNGKSGKIQYSIR
jgi:general secretion pathway protein C